MPEEQTTRRRFLTAALVFSGVGSTLGSSWLKSAAAWADGSELDTLGRMANHLFPHDGLDESIYGEIMMSVLDEAASDPAVRDQVDAAIASLDKAWPDLDAGDQLAVMQELQDEAFFVGIRESVRFRLYHHPKLWEHINYPGSSKEHGGYIRRGFNDIAWLPEDK